LTDSFSQEGATPAPSVSASHFFNVKSEPVSPDTKRIQPSGPQNEDLKAHTTIKHETLPPVVFSAKHRHFIPTPRPKPISSLNSFDDAVRSRQPYERKRTRPRLSLQPVLTKYKDIKKSRQRPRQYNTTPRPKFKLPIPHGNYRPEPTPRPFRDNTKILPRLNKEPLYPSPTFEKTILHSERKPLPFQQPFLGSTPQPAVFDRTPSSLTDVNSDVISSNVFGRGHVSGTLVEGPNYSISWG
jgi:hypothetical protein